VCEAVGDFVNSMLPPFRRTRCQLLFVVASYCATKAYAAVDFENEIKPILESTCVSCHNAINAEGDLRLDTFEASRAARELGAVIIPRDAEKSSLYTTTVLPDGHEKRMPPDGPRLDQVQTERLRQWIDEGAAWPPTVKLETRPRINFAEHVQPILEMHCLSCHTTDNAEGEFNLASRQSAFESGINAPAIVPFNTAESPIFKLTSLPKDDPALMPPGDQGGPLSKEDVETLRQWIEQGAIWPKDISLTPRMKKPASEDTPDNFALVERIHAKILAQANADEKFAEYSAKIPETGITYHMVPIAGGEFLMGSHESEPGRQENEGPQRKVKVSPFWMGKYEVTWDEFDPFMITTAERFKNGARKDFDPAIHDDVDAVTGPTAPYADMTFGMGKQGYPAICMTQHAANKYCQWLSAQTGRFYRLPTEAEWEYACRGGTTTAYSFGDDPEKLDEYAWDIDNSEEKSQRIGQKKPNPWGLYDMHGNVMEWTADQYLLDYFSRLARPAVNPFVRPETLFPRSARGGSWNDNPEQLRSASRLGSDAYWQERDPNLPKSIWYLTDAPWLGFRFVRPKEIPSVEEMYLYWNSSTGKR
jgi:formylglycine-generating enzyme required for sulfatase activity